MSWAPLSTVVRPLWRAARQSGAVLPADLREAAAVVCARVHAPTEALAAPALVNVAALAVAARERLVVHALRPAVTRLVHETDLHALPAEPPALLRGAWLVEARHAARGETLWGETACLAGYPYAGAIYLVGLLHPDGARVAPWRPRWEGRDLAAGAATGHSPLVDDVGAWRAWAREAARFAVVLGLLLDAALAPIRTEDEAERGRAPRVRRESAADGGEAWVTRHVYLTSPERTTPARADVAPGGGPAAADGRLAHEVPVRGHLRRQPHGPGGSLRRWIYVEGYEARRWVAPASTVVVGASSGSPQ